MRRALGAMAIAVLCAGAAHADGYSDFNAGLQAWRDGDIRSSAAFMTHALSAGDLPPYLVALAYYDRANSYEGLGQRNLAEADLASALALRPTFTDAYLLRALIRERARDFAGAIADYTALAAWRPQLWIIYASRGADYELIGQEDLALADMDKMIALRPTDGFSWFDRGVVQLDAGKTADAIESLRAAMKLLPAYAYAAIWLEFAQTKAAQAPTDLGANLKSINLSVWPGAVIPFLEGSSTADQLLAVAAQGETKGAIREQLCDAQYFIGAWAVLHNDPVTGKKFLTQAVSACAPDMIALRPASIALKQIP